MEPEVLSTAVSFFSVHLLFSLWWPVQRIPLCYKFFLRPSLEPKKAPFSIYIGLHDNV